MFQILDASFCNNPKVSRRLTGYINNLDRQNKLIAL